MKYVLIVHNEVPEILQIHVTHSFSLSRSLARSVYTYTSKMYLISVWISSKRKTITIFKIVGEGERHRYTAAAAAAAADDDKTKITNKQMHKTHVHPKPYRAASAENPEQYQDKLL